MAQRPNTLDGTLLITLTCQQELSAPEVVSYLMGWGDQFISHHFKTIHWYAVLRMLKTLYPVLRSTRSVCQLPLQYITHSFGQSSDCLPTTSTMSKTITDSVEEVCPKPHSFIS